MKSPFTIHCSRFTFPLLLLSSILYPLSSLHSAPQTLYRDPATGNIVILNNGQLKFANGQLISNGLAVDTALADRATDAELTAHVNNTSNPHTVTKSQTGLGNADNTSDANKPVSTAQQTALDGKAAIAEPIAAAHAGRTDNPHSVTKTQIGLANADNTSDASKPVSTATQTALDGKAASSEPIAEAHAARTDNPHTVNKTQVGLGNADNISDANKPISTATQTALDSKAASSEPIAAAHAGRTDNPHTVTKTQVGLANADNTSDVNKPVSTATQTALDGKAASSEPIAAAHASRTDNPHTVTKTQVGLANADNTSDANKPVSTATQTALDGKSSTAHTHTGVYQPADADLDTWATKTAPSGAAVGTTDTQTLSNKTINGASNNLTVRAASDITGTLPVANGGTGDTGTAWTSYSPTVTPFAGSFISASATGFYKTIGKTVHVNILVSITLNGTATTSWTASLPVTAKRTSNLSVCETALNGFVGHGAILSPFTGVHVTRYDNAYLGSDAQVISVSGSYEAE